MYNDPILKKYIELFKENIPEIKTYFQGDPIRIPKSSLPALIISKTQTTIAPLTNAEDLYNIGVLLTIVTDVRDERSDDQELAPGIAQLYDIIEGREDDGTFKLKTKSLLHVLRNNQIVDAANNLRTDLQSMTRADYGLTLGKRSPEGYATEGQVEFLSTYSQLRN